MCVSYDGYWIESHRVEADKRGTHTSDWEAPSENCADSFVRAVVMSTALRVPVGQVLVWQDECVESDTCTVHSFESAEPDCQRERGKQ